MNINRRNTLFALATLAFGSGSLAAQESPDQNEAAQVLRYGNQPHIAYIQTNDTRVNTTSKNGMAALQDFLHDRTSLLPAEEVVALDPETDSLIPFKFIYWPIVNSSEELSEQAQKKVQDYIRAGKIILFDNKTIEVSNTKALARIMSNVNPGVLEPLNDHHPLTYTFYKVSNLPGVTNIAPVEVQSRSASSSESISSLIIGRRDWARAWAGIGTDKKGREMALRGAADVVLYAYTGNYKPDQFILNESLDRINE